MTKLAKRILPKALAAVIALMLAVPIPALPADNGNRNGNGHTNGNGNGSVKVGHVTYITGEVFVRSKGAWKPLSSTPYPLYSTDRIATKSGRANIAFVDGSVMRMNTDTSLRIVRYDEGGGRIFKSARESSTQVDVIVGDVWFNVKTQKETRFGFRTPSMTAAIRGTEGNVTVGLGRETNFILSSGSSLNTGIFTQMPSDSDAKFGTTLKPSSSRFLSSPVVKAMDEAMSKQAQADAASAKTKEITGDVKAIQAASTEPINARLATAKVGMGMARADEAEASARALFASAREDVDIAEYLGDKAAAAQAQDSLNAAKSNLNKVAALREETASLAKTLNYTTSSPKLATALSALVESVADTAKAYSSVVKANTIAVFADSAGNPSAAQAAQAQASRAETYAVKAESARATISTFIGSITEGIDNGKGRAIATAALIVAEAISTHSSAAEAQTRVAVELVSGDAKNLALAEQAATISGQLSTQAAYTASPTELAAAVKDENNARLGSLLASSQDISKGAESLAVGVLTAEGLPNTNIAPMQTAPPPSEGQPAGSTTTEQPSEGETTPEEESAPQEPAPDIVTGALGGGGNGDPNISPYTF